jgi:hypothetical protein
MMTVLLRRVVVSESAARRHAGTVELWHDARQFGIIRRDDTDDSVTAPLANCERALKRGERVTFEQGMTVSGKHLGKAVRLMKRRG